MEQLVDLDRLSLRVFRQSGTVPKDTPELRRRIQKHGFIDPVVVRRDADDPDRFQILSNPEAYIAAGKLGISRVPVVIRDDLDDEAAASIVRAQYDSVKGNPIEEAEWYQERLDAQKDLDDGPANIAKLARITGKSRSHVSRSLTLLTFPPEVQNCFRRGELSAAHGRFLSKIKNPAKQIALAALAVNQKLSVRDLQAAVGNAAGEAAPKPVVSAAKDPDTLRLERRVTELIGSPTTIDTVTGELRINFFKNYETLDGILSRLGYRPDD